MLILASGSPYRRELLGRLRLPFKTLSPDIDETPLANEAPSELAPRLAKAKALATAQLLPDNDAQYSDALIIGSDQVATIDGQQAIGKPGNFANARQQLMRQSGKTVSFYTALTLYDCASEQCWQTVVTTEVGFRHLSEQEIETYLRLEQPWDCAGAAKCEGLGISLLERISGPDPTALIGLPLIALSTMLAQAGHSVMARLDSNEQT